MFKKGLQNLLISKEGMTLSHRKRATTNISELAWGKIKGQGVATLSN